MRKTIIIALIALVLVVAISFFIFNQSTTIVKVYVSTTTSLYETGLLDYLTSKFTQKYPGVNITFLVVGSGEALERAERGDACVTLVHAPSLEVKYLINNTIYNHTIFAYNYFIIVGPGTDPANVSRAGNTVEAFRRIYEAAERGLTVFISRGDKSGTNVKELQLWNLTGVNPSGKNWYKNCGCGMSNALIMANELNGYTLSDISTFLKLKKNGQIPYLEVLFQNSSELINIYSAYLSSKCSGEELKYGRLFIEFLASSEGQNYISTYGLQEYGKPLFNPVDGKEQELADIWSALSRS
ncbi:substrate-binding domain-containing protein [Desulfurococcus amylolyticus]|uniref:ABC-type tungstate transport system, permease component, TupB n=1 Tax=Desulfurococcus amylolyticus DSM 16532 TaxID=768672 RepID=I3XQ48_DESAM|nr:substrate-binding domain-containing protein [Desulfurococcus amylolyticus]AFL66072.1 ABC-type tungstate transport system, permease component, TupB [Desulfurococcus amylolyticus DSM 16532]